MVLMWLRKTPVLLIHKGKQLVLGGDKAITSQIKHRILGRPGYVRLKYTKIYMSHDLMLQKKRCWKPTSHSYNKFMLDQDDELGEVGGNHLGQWIPFFWGMYAFGDSFETQPQSEPHATTKSELSERVGRSLQCWSWSLAELDIPATDHAKCLPSKDLNWIFNFGSRSSCSCHLTKVLWSPFSR